jgi:ferritin-like metal-binding protein YciE
MKLQSLRELFLMKLGELYDTEKQITKALPEMIEVVKSDDLKKALTDHLDETEDQVIRLEKVFTMIDEKPMAKKSSAIKGILDEGKEIISMKGAASIIDAGAIAAAEAVEHYEIAAYTSVIAWAKLLGFDEAADLFKETLHEEENASKKLLMIAERKINEQALDDSNE